MLVPSNTDRKSLNALRKVFITLFWLSVLPAIAQAQQPFVTDDADVTPRYKFHFEFSNEFDLLPKSSLPNLKQNTASFELNYGLLEGVEIGIEVPLIAIFNTRATSPRIAFGVGDSNLAVKYNFLVERAGSRLPAMTVSFNLEIPTGDKDRQLGTSLVDYSLNGVLQKSLTEKTKLRLNGGILFSGNTLTGAIGIKARGIVFTGGVSVVKEFTSRLDLGVEIAGAFAPRSDLGEGLLQIQFGGNYALSEKITFDFGIIGGRFAASPRAGLQVGLSVDF